MIVVCSWCYNGEDKEAPFGRIREGETFRNLTVFERETLKNEKKISDGICKKCKEKCLKERSNES